MAVAGSSKLLSFSAAEKSGAIALSVAGGVVVPRPPLAVGQRHLAMNHLGTRPG